MPVYVIQAGEGGPCKIGHATNVAKRRSQLQCSTHVRLRVVAVYEGGEPQERVLHELFKADRLGGEWFNLRLPDALEAITLTPVERKRSKAPNRGRPLREMRPYLITLMDDRGLELVGTRQIAPTATVSQLVEMTRLSNAFVRNSDEDELGIAVLLLPIKPPKPLFLGPLISRCFVSRSMGSA